MRRIDDHAWQRRATALVGREPGLSRLIDLARERVRAKQVWLFGSRARGDAGVESDWDILSVLPNDASDKELDVTTAWRIGRDAGLVADVVSDREDDLWSAVAVENPLAFVVSREGIEAALLAVMTSEGQHAGRATQHQLGAMTATLPNSNP